MSKLDAPQSLSNVTMCLLTPQYTLYHQVPLTLNHNNVMCFLILCHVGKAALQVISKDTTDEFVCLLLAVLFGSYCLIGGLGTTFYIAYFNTALIFITTSIFILKTTYFATPEVMNMTSIDVMYDAMSCLEGPEGNYDQSLLTYRSESGLINGIVVLFMTIAVIFCDQSNWQSKIAAKPTEGVVGFLLAGFLWFAIPTSLSYKATLVYKTMSYQYGSNLLTDDEINAGRSCTCPSLCSYYYRLICQCICVSICMY